MSRSDDVTFQAFLDWLPAAEPAGDVRAMITQYRQALVAQGARDDEAGKRIEAVLKTMHSSDAAWSPLFDKIYASAAPSFRSAPNTLLQEAVAERPPGEALEVCMGEGRNAVYLAAQGWAVTGFDLSEVGLQRAQARADALGVSLTTFLQTSDAFDYGVDCWDLIALVYAPIRVTDATYVAKLRRALRPKGLIALESFAVDSAMAKRPVQLEPEALREAFSAFDILRFEVTHDLPDWSQEEERLVRLIAEKP